MYIDFKEMQVCTSVFCVCLRVPVNVCMRVSVPVCPSVLSIYPCVRACVRVCACTCVTYEKRSGLVILLSTFLGYVCVLL